MVVFRGCPLCSALTAQLREKLFPGNVVCNGGEVLTHSRGSNEGINKEKIEIAKYPTWNESVSNQNTG